MSLEPGTRVGRYTISRLVAQGGMAEVYRAEQDLTGGIVRPVAVKVIRPEYSESADFREMFLDEARTACTLSHPNIVHIYEVGESEDGLLYMAMELVAGETLATVNRTLRTHDERFSDEALFSIGILCCSALDAVHALKVESGHANLVHRDVSPHNLLLSTSGSLKLIDFGIAKAATNRNLTMPGVTKGKAGYFSPEQAMGKKLDGRSDLFSLGVTLYKLASGGTPFDEHKNHGERHAALVRGQWKNLEEVYPGLPDGFYEVVKRSLGVKQEDRYQTAREMREALERAAFDAHIRIGQSSLMGYLDDDGEVTAEGGSRMSAFPGISAGPSITIRAPVTSPMATPAPQASSVRSLPAQRQRHSTERLPPLNEAPPSKNRGLLIGAFALAVALGVGATVALLGPSSEPLVVAPPPPRVEPKVVAARVDPPRDPPLLFAEKIQPPIDAGEETIEVEEVVRPTPTLKPKVIKPKVVSAVKPPVEKTEKPQKVDAPPPVPKDEPIPEGTGKLVISVGDNTARHIITVQGEEWGTPPMNRKVSSGLYKVQVKLENGTVTTFKAAVMPDKTTVLTLDPANLRWSSRSQ
ncbi:MAG: protein kinase [Archangium sp.]|nr:protein kinase [Archangium sp.]MDP3154567.1 protein kinase [Archangium sp.]MDP3569394.1 protein kinase [Archangium sp.]